MGKEIVALIRYTPKKLQSRQEFIRYHTERIQKITGIQPPYGAKRALEMTYWLNVMLELGR